ncbi:MAG: PEP-utilizing enzyme [Aquamicrobium sp.]|uniref:PEP/pyruvate-binding domain-containing protein n=1 Tax=Aquamicrobium sp. TaxID=1872579 RepID=UPI00349EB964|nr:PEP-utilizing enzyme [Aquamicrobium sp.]
MKDQIFRFSGALCDWQDKDQKKAKAILGGKGAGLVMMAQAGMPVPPGFTITTTVCNELAAMKEKKLDLAYGDAMTLLMAEVDVNDAWLAGEFGYAPLVSVRSGAPLSMPGMMDTILNVGLTSETVFEWEDRLGQRAAWDSYRRLIQMLGSTAYGVPMKRFDNALTTMKKHLGVEQDTDLGVVDLQALVDQYLTIFFDEKGVEFPQTRKEQLTAAVKAVFNSWMNPRAIEYRKLNNIDASMGTAVNVQAMVFGNMNDKSGTGVLFTRNPSTGEAGMFGEFLVNAQGEDVVAGIRTPQPVHTMGQVQSEVWDSIYSQLLGMCAKLETAYKDMVDIEFTVQDGELFILQSRTGKRSAAAAFQIAVDLVNDAVIDAETALSRLTEDQYRVVKRPIIDPKFDAKPDFVGLPACPGVATGKPVFSSSDAVNCTEPCILVTHETTPDDIAGMNAAAGILTQTGGATSHAAVVARAMDKSCVVGCTDLDWSMVKAAKRITIDGATGQVWVETEVPVVDSSQLPAVKTVGEWCMMKVDAIPGVPVDDDQVGGEHQCIQVAYWWGHDELIDVLVSDLKDQAVREFTILDLRSPLELMQPEDADLVNAFGVNPYADDFDTALKQALFAAGGELKGLRVKGLTGADTAVFNSLGFVVLGSDAAPAVCPVDYAVFSTLSQAS